jgi:hypothetical protein
MWPFNMSFRCAQDRGGCELVELSDHYLIPIKWGLLDDYVRIKSLIQALRTGPEESLNLYPEG